MLKRTLLSSAAAVVLICGAPAAMAKSSHDQKAKTGQEMSQPQKAGQHESRDLQSRPREAQKDKRAGSSQASENKAGQAANQSAKAPESQAKPSTTGQATHEESSSPSKNTGLSEKPSRATSDSQKSPEKASKSSQSKQAQPDSKAAQTPANRAAQAPAIGTTDKQTGEEKSSSPNAQKNAVAPQNNGTASNSAQPSNAESKKVEVQGANLSPDQRTKVTRLSQSIVSRNDAPRIGNPDFSVSIGTVIPAHVHYVRVPETLVEVYPQWRDDDYFVVRDEIVIVDHSRRIVAVIPAGSERASSEATTVVDLSPAEIREVQTVLIEKGYLHGHADGEWGSRTRDALISFQRKEGVDPTGRIDERTVQSLGLSGKIKTSSKQGGNENAGSQPENASNGAGSQAKRNATPARESTGSASGNTNGTGKSSDTAGRKASSPNGTSGQGTKNGAPPNATEQKGSVGQTNDQGTTPKTEKRRERYDNGAK
jgi:hypothetical protein